MMAETELIDHSHIRNDLRRLESAIRKGWQIPDAVFEKAGAVIGQILATGNNREKVAAARVLVAMNAQNNPQQQKHHHHIHELVPITEDNLAAAKQRLAARIAGGR